MKDAQKGEIIEKIVNNKIQEELTKEFSRKLLNLLHDKTVKGPRSFGFEYEFLPKEILSLNDMVRLYAFLPKWGFSPDGAAFISPSGMRIAFEPGGQIEYCSPPLFPEEEERLDRILAVIEETNGAIHRELGIDYIALDYIPDRADAPLCLNSKRYLNLHARMPEAGTRGREMMKGTASIHLHVAILGLHELLPLFLRLSVLSRSAEFEMSPNRRDIWDNTDPTRCGLPPALQSPLKSIEQWVERFVRFTLNAVDLYDRIPFYKKRNITFQGFLDHMTTIFTDVRLNLKGPTIELRTLDSIPLEAFRVKWKVFVDSLKMPIKS